VPVKDGRRKGNSGIVSKWRSPEIVGRIRLMPGQWRFAPPAGRGGWLMLGGAFAAFTAAGMRGRHGEVVPVRPHEVERVVNAARADFSGPQAFCRVVTACGLDIVHHQAERCGGPDDQRLVRLADHDVASL
jgi:hypothetical protein